MEREIGIFQDALPTNSPQKQGYLLQPERGTIMQREAVNKYVRVEQEQKMSSGSSGRNTASGLAPDNADLPLSS